jgi:solute carrier family 30 (zinc transporter), member 1
MPMLRKDLQAIAGVKSIHELHVWQLSNDKWIGSLHFRYGAASGPAAEWARQWRPQPGVNDLARMIGELKEVFHRHGVHNTTIQPEFAEQCGTVRDHCHEPVCETVQSCAGATAHH